MSVVSCQFTFIPQLLLQRDHCCEANLPQVSMINLPVQSNDQFMAYGVWLSMLNSGWQQARKVCSAAT